MPEEINNEAMFVWQLHQTIEKCITPEQMIQVLEVAERNINQGWTLERIAGDEVSEEAFSKIFAYNAKLIDDHIEKYEFMPIGTNTRAGFATMVRSVAALFYTIAYANFRRVTPPSMNLYLEAIINRMQELAALDI